MIDETGTLRQTSLNVTEHDDHFHNLEWWFGKLAVQTATNWMEHASLAPFRAISGNNDFGSDPGDEAQVVGSADTPAIRLTSTQFDIRRIHIEDVSNNATYLMRIIYGTGTMADAETALQYTEIPSLQVASPNGQAKPVDDVMLKSPVGTKVWIRVKNATDNAWIDFLVGIHEYPAPEYP